MTAAALTLSSLPAVEQPRRLEYALPRWALVFTAIVIGGGFFLTGHDFNISHAVAYTQTAEEMELAAQGGNTLRRLAFLTIAAWGMVLLAVGRRPLKIHPVLAASLILLLTLTATSFAWADDPGLCLRRMLSLLCCVIAAAGMARAFSLRDIHWIVLGVLGSLAVIGLVAELRLGSFRPWSGDYRFAGTVHPNTQGPALATLCLAAVGLAREGQRGRIWLWSVCAVAFVLLVLTKSRTTTAAAILSLAAVQMVHTPLRTKVAAGAALGWLACLGLWLLWTLGFDPLVDFRDALLLGRAEESDTLSGRAFIWPEVLYYAGERSLLGYGYESFWTSPRIETISTNLGWGLREAHNGYLDVLLSIGAVGLVLVLLVVGSAIAVSVRCYRLSHNSLYTLPLGLAIFGLINAGLESGMVVVNLVPFLLGCCFFQLAFFREAKVSAHDHA